MSSSVQLTMPNTMDRMILKPYPPIGQPQRTMQYPNMLFSRGGGIPQQQPNSAFNMGGSVKKKLP